MATANQCYDSLKTQFQLDFSQKENISQLITKARWGDKSECVSHFGSISNIKTYLNNIQNNNDIISNEIKTITSDSDAIKIETTSTKNNQTSSTSSHSAAQDISDTTAWMLDGLSSGLETIWRYVLYVIIGIIAIKFMANLIKKTLRRGYAFLNNHRMIYMKVLVPRWDSKVDREQAKEMAKDMKEKIG